MLNSYYIIYTNLALSFYCNHMDGFFSVGVCYILFAIDNLPLAPVFLVGRGGEHLRLHMHKQGNDGVDG